MVRRLSLVSQLLVMNMSNPARVLIVDDHVEMARSLADGLRERGYVAVCAASGREAIEALSSQRFDAVVTDLRMPSVDGMEVLAVSRKLAPDRPVIIMTAFSAIENAVESIRQGAYHYLTKPFKIGELEIFLGRALEEVEMRRETTRLRRALEQEHVRSRIVGSSPAMHAVRELIERVADAPAPVLILAKPARGKGWWLGPFTNAAAAPTPDWSQSIAHRCPRRCWKARCLGT